MAKTVEIYLRAIDPTAVASDAQFVNAPGNRTQGSVFVPELSLRDIVGLQEQLEPVFGTASDQLFAVDPRLRELEAGEPVVVASGICAFPMDYNARLNPSDGPGSARWYDSQSGELIVLSRDVDEAVQAIIENPPPLMIANLMKAGGLSPGPTVLIEEVRFYTDWMLDKLRANNGGALSEETVVNARARLGEYIRAQFVRNRLAFERLRRETFGTQDLAPVTVIDDTAEAYQQCIDEQVERWQRELPEGNQLDVSALRAAAYYSAALQTAYRSLGVLRSDAKLIIAEGASNLIVPNNGTRFNDSRRAAFSALAATANRPLVAFYPSPSLSPSIRKEPLEAGAVAAVPSTRQPNVAAYIKTPKGAYAAVGGPVVRWSMALPGTPRVRSAQLEAIGSPGGSDAEAQLLAELRAVVERILDEKD